MAIRALVERFPDLAEDPDGPLEWIPGAMVRGVRRYPVRW